MGASPKFIIKASDAKNIRINKGHAYLPLLYRINAASNKHILIIVAIIVSSNFLKYQKYM